MYTIRLWNDVYLPYRKKKNVTIHTVKFGTNSLKLEAILQGFQAIFGIKLILTGEGLYLEVETQNHFVANSFTN